MPGVTVSAGYGAAGSVIAPAVARRLGATYLDRAISSRVADQLGVSVEEAEGGGVTRSLVDRVLRALSPLGDGAFGTVPPNAFPAEVETERFRDQSERIMRDALAGGAVILGRAGAAALRDEPDVLRVRLFGPVEARIRQAAVIESVDVATARRRLPEIDRARAHYVRRLYSADINDPTLYHLQIDSTALPHDACVDIIAMAYAALVASTAA
jgi:cytidylate kinase